MVYFTLTFLPFQKTKDMKFIYTTTTDGVKVSINPQYIVLVTEIDNGTNTQVVTVEDNYDIDMPYEEFISLLDSKKKFW